MNHGSVQFAQAAYSVAESAGSITLSVQRSGGTDGAISVNYATATGTALAPGDFTATNGILNWLAGDASAKSIIVPISDDSSVEPSKAFTLTLSNPLGGATIGTPATATVTITDDDVPPANAGAIQFAQTDYSVSEAAGTVTLVATRTGGTDGMVSGYYRTTNGTALAGLDYTATTNLVSWANGDAAPKNIVLSILNDSLVEPAEPFTVSLIATSGGATIGTPATATVTITDDDVPPANAGAIQFAQTDYSVSEAAGTVTLVATRTGGTDGMVSGYYRTTNGTALAGLDYTATTNLVSWAAGDAAPKNIVLTLLNDSLVEPAETFTVSFIATSGGATIGTPATATVTITDDDVVIPENHAPVLPPNAVFTILKLTELVVTNTATDGDLPAQTLTYELLAKPTGATIDANGIVRWTPSTASTNFFQTRVTDNGVPARSATNNFYVIVTEPPPAENHAPVLPPNAVFTILKLTELVVTNTATDSDLSAQTLTYELLANPAGATIDANGIVRWTPSTASTNFFQTRVTDNGIPARSATNNFYVIVTEPLPPAENHAPILPRPTVVTVVKLTEMVFTNSATDIDLPPQTLTYELLANPTGATIDANGIVRWTPSALQSPSTNRFRVKVTDSGLPARSATNVFYAIVTEGNTAPHLFGPSSLILSNNAPFAESFRASDSDAPGNHLTFQLISGPDWVSFNQTDATHARLAGTPPTVTIDTSFTVVLQVSDDGSPPLSSRLSLRLYVRPTAPPCAVARQLPVGYVPGTSLTITLRANPGDGTTSFTVADAPPAGWTIGAISDAGQFDTPSGTVRFGPFTDATPRTLTYAVTPPLTETGPKTFAGIVARNGIYTGVCGYDVLPPLNNHPADSSPADLRLTAAEVSAYAAAWKTGTPWPGSTNPINLAFVTRADYLQRNGETYTLNSAATPPLLWIPTPRAGLAARIPATTGAPVSKGCWRFLPHKLAVGVTAIVNLVVNPAPTDTSYAIEETRPPGWTVANISHDGAYDSASGRIRWGLFSDGQPRTLTYELTPTGAFAPFTGIASFDGSTLPVAGASQPEVLPAISETEFAPATRLPSGEIVLPLATRVGTITVIEISGDLRLWTPIWTNAPGAQIFRELPVNIPAGRFYRLVEQ